MKDRERQSEEPTSAARMVQQPDQAPHAGVNALSSMLWQASSVRVPPGLGSPPGILALQQMKGNRVVSRMLAVQQSVEAQGLREPSVEEIHSAATEGIRTPSTTLPFIDRIQASFGRHSIGHIKAHVGPEATKASQAMNALAFASGDHVVLGGVPDLRTAAHEAAHIVQQQAGVQLANGLGHEGDPYERHADAVANAVAGGRSSEELLTARPFHQPLVRFGGTTAVQRVLDGNEEEGQEIKIWDQAEEDAVPVIFVKQEGDFVFYVPTKVKGKIPPKGKGGYPKIDKNLAFPMRYKDSQVKAEVAQSKEAEDAVENSEYGKLKIPAGVFEYLLEIVKKESGDDLDVPLTPDRIKLCIASLDSLATLFTGDALSLEKFKEVDSSYYIDEIMEFLKGTGTYTGPTGASGASGARGASGQDEWKKGKTEELKKALLDVIPQRGLGATLRAESTLHHKISRSHFKRLMKLLRETPSSQPGVDDMWKFLSKISGLTRIGDHEAALENWTANIELGVLANRRQEGDDPGEEFDGNFPNEMATPRTERLQEVDLIIGGAARGHDVKWDEVLELLTQTQFEHEKLTAQQQRKPYDLSWPILGQWTDTGSGFVRDKDKGQKGSDRDLGAQVIYDPNADREVVRTVLDFMAQHSYTWQGTLYLVDGTRWTCYVRCVLFALERIGAYEAVMAEIGRAGIDVGDGVEVGSDQETAVMAAIQAVTGQQFWVEATDVQNLNYPSTSKGQEGSKINLVRTGMHFSLLR